MSEEDPKQGVDDEQKNASDAEAQALADAQHVHTALTKGWFTDKNGVFEVLCKRTARQLFDIRKAYDTNMPKYMLDDVTKNTSGHFESVCRALVLGPAEYDAYRIHQAISSLSTHAEHLTEILCHRTVQEVKDFNEAYQRMYDKSAYSAIRADLSGDLGHIYALLSDPANERAMPPNVDKQLEEDIRDLYDASQNKTFGHETGPFITILGSRNREYIFRLYAEYVNKHELTLEIIIKKWGIHTGDFEKALLAIVTPPAEFYARHLYDALKGIITNDDKLIRIVLAQRERNLAQIGDWFMHEYKKALKHFIKDDCSGAFKNSLVDIVEFYAEAVPDQ